MRSSERIMPVLVDEMFAPFGAMKAQGTTVLLVEQHVELALDIADRTDVLDQGARGLSRRRERALADNEIKERYARCDAVLQRDGQIVNAPKRHKTASPVLISIKAFCLIGEMLGLTNEPALGGIK